VALVVVVAHMVLVDMVVRQVVVWAYWVKALVVLVV
jgi:hypothetical protein